MIFPSYAQYQELCLEYKIIPVYQEVLVDMETPISIYKKLGNSKGSYLLESVEGGENLARYSFIGLEPFLVFQAKGEKVVIASEGKEEHFIGKPLSILADILEGLKAPLLEELPRFYGGAVGYFGYDLVRTWEELPNHTRDDLELPDCHFLLTKIVLIYDHVKHKLKIVYNSRAEQDMEKAYQKAIDKINQMLIRLSEPNLGNGQQQPNSSANLIKPEKQENMHPLAPGSKISSNISKAEYIEKVEQAKEYIKAGDIFQVVLSQRFQAPLETPPFEIYRSLRTINPSPYLYYLDLGETIIIGSSPEMLVRVEDERVATMPIAGTRPRGRNNQQDEALAVELLADTKEKAEHLMLVDLGRNDLGRVSEYGSVQVQEFMKVERYSHVMHLVSLVEGKLRKELNQFDALKACFPAGTLSGAPKIRAMEIIDELEPLRRGAYGGAIGYLSFTGNMETCITIRTLVINNNNIYLQAGAGIVADSDPEMEYQETVNKAMALLQTLKVHEQGKQLAAGRE